MIEIKITTQDPEFPLIRQTPGLKGIWGNCKFFINQDINTCDYWVVYDGLNEPESVSCPPQNTILITGEPPNIKRYNPKFLSQFSKIITCHKTIKRSVTIHSQQCLPWHLGINMSDNKKYKFLKNYDDFKKMQSINKNKILSIISSNKSFSKGHRCRLNFVKKIQNYFGNNIDVFGRGINDIADKWDAIVPYKYHIVIENSSHPDYFSEKLSDTFLGGSYPIYYGCTNINDYFPSDSLTIIDIENIDEAIEKIICVIENNTYDKRIDEIHQARNLILDEYNVFSYISKIVEPIQPIKSEKKQVTIKPELHFYSSFALLSSDLRNKIRRIIS